jgi:hypothetical protein
MSSQSVLLGWTRTFQQQHHHHHHHRLETTQAAAPLINYVSFKPRPACVCPWMDSAFHL